MGSSAIEWTDATWNPARGCSRVSPGCERCYAERVAARFSGPRKPFEGFASFRYRTVTEEHRSETGHYISQTDHEMSLGARWTGRVELVPAMLDLPLRWKTPRRIFVNSMSDLFHERLTNEEIAAVFGVMAAALRHTFQILTKRAERMRDWFRWVEREAADDGPPPTVLVETCAANYVDLDQLGEAPWPLPNVHLGVSVETQEYADERIPFLLDTPAALRFLSVEPQLGPIDLTRVDAFKPPPWPASLAGEPKTYLDVLRGEGLRPSWTGVSIESHIDARIGWVIQGGESGPRSRPFDLAWARALRDQCAAAGVPYFFKQAGRVVVASSNGGTARQSSELNRIRSRKGGVLEELPEDLRVRQFPEARP